MTSFWVSILHFRHGLKPVTTEKKKNRLSCLVIMLPTFFAVFLGTTSPNHRAYFPQPTDQSNKSYIIPHLVGGFNPFEKFKLDHFPKPASRGENKATIPHPIGNSPRFANYERRGSLSGKQPVGRDFFQSVFLSSVCWKQRTPSLEHDQISFTINSYPFSHSHGSVENSPKMKGNYNMLETCHFPLNHDYYGRKGIFW